MMNLIKGCLIFYIEQKTNINRRYLKQESMVSTNNCQTRKYFQQYSYSDTVILANAGIQKFI